MSTHGTFVIAEAGVNHNGSLQIALEMVDVAAEVGADAVKFQTFSADRLASTSARKADYQSANTGSGTQLEMLRQLELSAGDHHEIFKRCEERKIAFMSTAFDSESQKFLSQFAMPATKIPSGDVTAAPLVLEAATMGRPIIMSTGMCTLGEVEEALGVIAFGLTTPAATPSAIAFSQAYSSIEGRAALENWVTLLHCVTDYPAQVEDVNLRAIDVLRTAFGLPVGYSDHTLGIAVALAAVGRGAVVLEKHFTLDRQMDGPDHRASLEPSELRELVAGVRAIDSALGFARKQPAAAELRNRVAARRSLVASRAIRRGEIFDAASISLKRPGHGKRPMDYWRILGSVAARDYSADEVLDP